MTDETTKMTKLMMPLLKRIISESKSTITGGGGVSRRNTKPVMVPKALGVTAPRARATVR
jgi:hypothetical protein